MQILIIAEVAIWRAHTQRISSVVLVDRWNAILTGSEDGAVRLWTFQGHYIGKCTNEYDSLVWESLSRHIILEVK